MRPRKVTEEDLLKQAVGLIEAGGFENLSLHKLSDKLGIKPASLYNHITGLADLKRRLGTEAKHKFAELLREQVGDQVGKDGLHAYIDSYVAYADEHPELFLAMISLPDKDMETDSSEREIGKVFENVTSVFAISRQETQNLRRSVMSLARGYYVLNRADLSSAQLRKKNRDALNYMSDLILSYLEAQRPAEASA